MISAALGFSFQSVLSPFLDISQPYTAHRNIESAERLDLELAALLLFAALHIT